MRNVKLGDRVIGDDYPTFIIAEMAWSHDGSVENARKIIKGAADAGADAISLHITSIKDYMVRDYGCSAGQTVSTGKEKERIYNYLDRINIKASDWDLLLSYARSVRLAICAMPNDMQSLRLCEKLNPDIYVIASSCFVEENLVSEVAKKRKPVILRVGGATLGEIENTVNLIKQYSNDDIILLHGIQLYPTKLEDTHLRLIPSLKTIFGLQVGLADHIDAESELALIIPLIAIPLGATVIEKHITHDRSLRGEDFEAALNPNEFRTFVEYVREAEKSLGDSHYTYLSGVVLKYRTASRKRVVTSKKISKGAKVTENDIEFKRADEGIYPDESRFIIGRTVNQNIEEDKPITWDKLL
jgi:sialic acid synthase SpsE